MIATVIAMIKFKNSTIAVISDLHLGIHVNSTTWHGIALNWAKWLRDELHKKQISDIVFCGDWHHNRNEISVNTLQVSADILEILSDFNIIAIAGNHDLFYKHRTDVNSLSIFKNRENISIIDANTVTINQFGKTITFCPWNTDITNITKSDIVFGHFEIESFSMNSYKVCEEGIKVKDILNKCPLLFSGHFHIRHSKQYSNGTIQYVGNPFQMDFGDLDNSKGYYTLNIDTSEYEFFENTISPKYKKISLSDLVHAGNFTSEVINNIHNNIVKLKIDKNISQEDVDLLLQKISLLKPQELTVDYDINFNRLIDESKQREDLSGVDIEQAIVEFVNLLEIKDKKAIINYTVKLYKSCYL